MDQDVRFRIARTASTSTAQQTSSQPGGVGRLRAQLGCARRNRGRFPDLAVDRAADAQHLGDEWSLMEDTQFPYGVDVGIGPVRSRSTSSSGCSRRFSPQTRTCRSWKSARAAARITALLLPRARQLYAVDVSAAMLERLQQQIRRRRRGSCRY